MPSRPNPFVAHGDLVKPLIDLGTTVHAGLEPGLMFLVRIRASQMNGCTASLYNNIRLAREAGESDERIEMLAGWRRSPLYTARERAALCWTEAVTLVSASGAPDDAYGALAADFDAEEQVKLTLMIAVINAFNRLGVAFAVGHPPGDAARAS